MNQIKNQKISDWLYESTLWRSDVAFWLDETESFQSVLTNAVKSVYEPSFLKQMDHLQNIVTYYGSEVLVGVKSKVFHHREELLRLKESGIEEGSDLVAKNHEKLGKELEGIEKLMREYKEEFSILKQRMDEQSRIAAERIGHILVPTDFSDNANKALDYALSIFGKGAKKLSLLHVIPHQGRVNIDTDEQIYVEHNERLEQELDRIQTGFPDIGSKLEIILKIGDLSSWISDICEAEDVDLIIMGTQGATKLSSALTGSNTSELIRKVMTPILVIPSETPLLPPRRMAFTTDLRAENRPEGLGLLKTISEIYAADLRVIHVESKSEHIDSVHDKVQIVDAMENLGLEDLKLEMIMSDDILVGINDYIKENYIDLLTMVTHHGGLFHSLFAKSMSKHMVLHSHTPILVLHSKS